MSRTSEPSGLTPSGTAAKVTILGTPISQTSYAEVLRYLAIPAPTRSRVLAFCNVHSVMTARKDPRLHQALVDADITTPDGMPLVWALRRRGNPLQPRVYGPDLMELALAHGVALGWRHFFLGSNEETLARLTASARDLAPGVQVVDTLAPPFRPLTPTEEASIIDRIQSSGANLVWVGLGMPKQELWMHHIRARLPGVTLLGVGAAFDLLSGTVPQAPDWLQDRGLEWAYRLWREPRRLWRRYLFNNPAFALMASAETLRCRVPNRHRS
jgi:N-acetylglucosaminyldiphosphoundecaprenol N-acetyl-beta-D-mannosaminyltransferase